MLQDHAVAHGRPPPSACNLQFRGCIDEIFCGDGVTRRASFPASEAGKPLSVFMPWEEGFVLSVLVTLRHSETIVVPLRLVRLSGPVNGRSGVCRDLTQDLRRIKELGVGCVVWYVQGC